MEFYISGGLSFVASCSTCVISQVSLGVITSCARTFLWRQWKKLLVGNVQHCFLCSHSRRTFSQNCDWNLFNLVIRKQCENAFFPPSIFRYPKDYCWWFPGLGRFSFWWRFVFIILSMDGTFQRYSVIKFIRSKICLWNTRVCFSHYIPSAGKNKMEEVVFDFRKFLCNSGHGVGPATVLLRSQIFLCWVFHSDVYHFQDIPGSTILIEVAVASLCPSNEYRDITLN